MFLKYFLILVNKFGKGFKLKIFFLLLFSIFGGLLELLGIAMIFPVMLVLTSSDTLGGQAVINYCLKILPDFSTMQIAFCLSIFMIFVFLFKNLFMMFCINLQNEFVRHWSDDINNKVVKKLLSAPCESLSNMTYGDKNTLLFSAVREVSLDFLLRTIILFANGIVACFILFVLFYKFTLPAFLSTAFIIVYAYFENIYFKKKAKDLGDIGVELLNDYAKNVNSVIMARKEILISNKQEYFADYLMNSVKKISDNYSKRISYGNFPLYVTEIGVIFSFLIMVVSIIFMDEVSKASIVSSLAIIALIVLRLVPQLNKVLISMYAINVSKQKVIWFLEKYEEISKVNYEKSLTDDELKFEKEIELSGVSLNYGDKKGLSDINLKIKKGEFIGIIGESGSGKTSLVDVITGAYSKTTGNIFVDGIEITPENLFSFQKNISILPQAPVFFMESIAFNVAFGEKDIDLERVKNALKLAGLEIDPKTSVFELSIGQKHRVALARSYYKDFQILVLDEATSSLDVDTENFVMENIVKLKGEKTIIAIAHKLNTLKKCDRIIYLADGKIKDTGTFEQLRTKHLKIDNMLKISSFD